MVNVETMYVVGRNCYQWVRNARMALMVNPLMYCGLIEDRYCVRDVQTYARMLTYAISCKV